MSELLLEESNVQPVSTPVTVCGDIHGQVFPVLLSHSWTGTTHKLYVVSLLDIHGQVFPILLVIHGQVVLMSLIIRCSWTGIPISLLIHG